MLLTKACKLMMHVFNFVASEQISEYRNDFLIFFSS